MSLLRALAAVSTLTFASRVLGYVRDFAIARTFGAGMATDAFFVAFRIPNLLRRLFGEGAFSQAFVPLLAETRRRATTEETRALVDRVATALAVVLALTAAAGVAGAPLIVWLSAPGFASEPEKFALTATLLRITFPYVALISLVAFAAGVLNTWSRFAVPAITPALLNIAFIAAATVAAPWFDPPVLALAWAVIVGGIAQLALQLPFLARIGMLPRWRLDLRHPGLARLLRLMAPSVFGVSVAQVSLLLNTVFASFLVSGSVSWLYYADRLMELPAGVLGVAVGTILLPNLARSHAAGARADYSGLLDWGLRVALLLALPAAAALAALAVPLIATLFQYGRFGASDVRMTEQALVAYSAGLVGIIVVKILAPGFYAQQDVRTPVRIGVLTLLATQAMNLAFIGPLRHAGLALAIALGSCLNAALLLRGLRRSGAYAPQPGWPAFALKLAAATAAMAALLVAARGPVEWWLAAPWQWRVPALLGLVALGGGAYGAALYALGLRPADFARRAAL